MQQRSKAMLAGFVVITIFAGALATWAALPPTVAPDGCEREPFSVPKPGTGYDADKFNRMPIECPHGWRPMTYAD